MAYLVSHAKHKGFLLVVFGVSLKYQHVSSPRPCGVKIDRGLSMFGSNCGKDHSNRSSINNNPRHQTSVAFVCLSVVSFVQVHSLFDKHKNRRPGPEYYHNVFPRRRRMLDGRQPAYTIHQTCTE